MSEKITNNPEADSQTVDSLYQQAVDYLETAIHDGTAKLEPTIGAFDMRVTAEVPEQNGKSLVLGYDRKSQDHDRTRVDTAMPLAWNDETGRNHWHTPVDIQVRDSSGQMIHDFNIAHSGLNGKAQPFPGWAYDNYAAGPYEDAPAMTALEANELTAQIEWAFENQ